MLFWMSNLFSLGMELFRAFWFVGRDDQSQTALGLVEMNYSGLIQIHSTLPKWHGYHPSIMRVYERQRRHSTHPATLWLDDGIHFLLIDLLQEHLGLYLTGLSFSHPRGAGANTEHGCKDFFHSFHIGDAIYYPFISDFVVFD